MEIQRDITSQLLEWKKSPRRKPLLLKGVRQCGKSWALEQFGKRCFNNYVVFNFEKTPELEELFSDSYDPLRLLTALSAHCGQRILPEETLVIFDEIQLCPRALNALKYFCEDAPQYAIAAAGSLLGISLASKEGFPVGKVTILEMHPCSFHEYLRVAAPSLAEYLGNVTLTAIPAVLSAKLETHLREYLTVGGLPEVLDCFLESHDIWKADIILDSILQTYENDFSKHIPARDIPKLHLIWKSIPEQFARENRRFLYGEVRSGARAKDLEDALQWLQDASLVHKVACAEVPEMPLLASIDRKAFKLFPTDVGVLRKLAKLPPATILNSQDLFADFQGRLTENYVLEQLASLGISPICYWYNPVGKAEVDFLIQEDDLVVPIEVKSGHSRNAKSLKTFRATYRPPIAVRTSRNNLRLDDGLLNLPLYLLGEMPRLLKLARTQNNHIIGRKS